MTPEQEERLDELFRRLGERHRKIFHITNALDDAKELAGLLEALHQERVADYESVKREIPEEAT